LIALEDSFWYLLNNPTCYCQLIFRFFDKNNLFVMFPHVENFFMQENQREQAVVREERRTSSDVQEKTKFSLEEIQEDFNEDRKDTITSAERVKKEMVSRSSGS